MSTPEHVEAATELAPRPRVLAVEAGGWPGLGGRARIVLGGARTVLVGKNGAGKSLLMDAVAELPLHAVAAQTPPELVPFQFLAEVEAAPLDRIAYGCRCDIEERDDKLVIPAKSSRPRWPQARRWDERCWRLADGSEIWRIEDGLLTIAGERERPFAPGVGLLGVPTDLGADDVSQLVNTLRRVLAGFIGIPAGVPRHGARREILVRRGAPPTPGGDRAGHLARSLVRLHEWEPESFHEIAGILRNIGLVEKVEVEAYKASSNGTDHEYRSVLFDGVNIGYLSDGTLRVCEIIVGLSSEDVSVLLVEEPETAVHPGLLHKLLAVIDAYTLDRQVVVSTHSPIVVNWCRPTDLRLVERERDVTSVRALSDDEVQRVDAYLNDEGTFSDFVYSQADE